MKEITKTYKVYEFDELKEAARARAINAEVTFMMETMEEDYMSAEVKRAWLESERMRTPWFLGEMIYDYAKEEVEENCRQCYYLADGTFFDVI